MGIEVIDIIIIGKHTVLPTDDARHKITLLIGIGHALLVDDGLSGGREVAPHFIQAVFYLCYLLERHWCSCVTLDTTLTFAGREVTAELLRQDV
jgi:hypothetical protein